MKHIVHVVSLTLFLCGCARSKTDRPDGRKNAPPDKSSAQTLVDGFTGRAAVEGGKKARRAIEEVSARQNEDLREVMGDD